MSKHTHHDVALDKLIMSFSYGLLYLLEAFLFGFRKIHFKSYIFIIKVACLLVLCFALAFGQVVSLFSSAYTDFIVIFLLSTAIFLVINGITDLNELKRYQRYLDEVGLKTAKGKTPRVLNIIKFDEFRTKLLISARAIGLDRFETKKGDLEASFQQIVESINTSKDRKFVEIFLTSKEFSKLSPFDDLMEKVDKPYHLLLGESRKKVEYTSLLNAPHFLISGTTGGGKSMFFNSCLLSLAKSTLQRKEKAAIQFYLLDLKKGVEVKPYEQWPNVKIAKDEASSLKILKVLVKEMNSRYELLEKREKGEKIITPDVHKKDILVLAIDEASVLFGKTSNKVKAKIINECRDTFDELCKLARASGIHIIAATQKPVKESLDSRSIENLAGRVAFKMASNAGSMLALGNGMATKLPDVKGRCIWKNGNRFEEVQAPYIDENQVMEECLLLAEEFNKKENGNYQEMLDFDFEIENSQKIFNKSLNKEVQNNT